MYDIFDTPFDLVRLVLQRTGFYRQAVIARCRQEALPLPLMQEVKSSEVHSLLFARD